MMMIYNTSMMMTMMDGTKRDPATTKIGALYTVTGTEISPIVLLAVRTFTTSSLLVFRVTFPYERSIATTYDYAYSVLRT